MADIATISNDCAWISQTPVFQQLRSKREALCAVNLPWLAVTQNQCCCEVEILLRYIQFGSVFG